VEEGTDIWPAIFFSETSRLAGCRDKKILVRTCTVAQEQQARSSLQAWCGRHTDRSRFWGGLEHLYWALVIWYSWQLTPYPATESDEVLLPCSLGPCASRSGSNTIAHVKFSYF
jgi:hypothetical protein